MTSYGTPANKIVGYTFNTEILCPKCVMRQMVAVSQASPAALDMSAEDALTQIADAIGLDRMDESSFDSSDFPKVVFACCIESDCCFECGEALS